MFSTLLALMMGIVAGSRTLLAPTAVSWAASQGWLRIRDPRLAFLAQPMTSKVLAGLALGELVGDKLPKTPSRTQPAPLIGRIASGALSGYVIGAASGERMPGLVAGAVGAASGTFGLRAARGWLAGLLGRDWPAAITEDAAAIASAWLIVQKARSDQSWMRSVINQLAFPANRVGRVSRPIRLVKR
jgi:uncharacterized membrane protein